MFSSTMRSFDFQFSTQLQKGKEEHSNNNNLLSSFQYFSQYFSLMSSLQIFFLFNLRYLHGPQVQIVSAGSTAPTACLFILTHRPGTLGIRYLVLCTLYSVYGPRYRQRQLHCLHCACRKTVWPSKFCSRFDTILFSLYTGLCLCLASCFNLSIYYSKHTIHLAFSQAIYLFVRTYVGCTPYLSDFLHIQGV